MSVLPAREAFFFVTWVGLASWARQGAAPGSPGSVSLPNFVRQSGRLGVLWEPGRPVLFPKWLFYVDESTPFGESSCFACTGALFLQAAGPYISQGRKMDDRFTRTGSFFFCPPGSRLGRGAQLGSARDAFRVTPAGDKVWKVLFCVGGSMPFTPRRHPGDIQETPRRHPGSIQETPRRHRFSLYRSI